MSAIDYAAALRDALYDPDPESSVRRTKELVIRELRDVDPRVDIKNTEYFNHTFSPDLVLSWPGASKRLKRYVFLRLPDNPAYFVEDVETVSELHPIVYGLNGGSDLSASLHAVARFSRENNVLVTDVHGIDRLARNRKTRNIANLVSAALIRGGRGVMDSAGAENLSSTVSDGFEAARAADVGVTASAVQALDSYLAPAQSQQMTQFLQAVWISSQGRIEGFPGPKQLSGEIGDESLEYLLQFDPINDPEFWRAFGASVTVDQLSRLKISGAPVNLQYLVTENLDRLWSRQMKVLTGELTLESMAGKAEWVIVRESLCLRGNDYTAFFAQNAANLRHIKAPRAYGLTMPEIRQRSRSVHLRELKMRTGGESFTVEAEGSGSVLEAESLSALPESYLAKTRVVRATAQTPGGQEIHCDFLERDATAVTSARVSLDDWLGSALPLLWDIPQESIPFLHIHAGEDDEPL
ncbi:hypothetical protein AB0950_35215 [Streptomyces sp. NPDC007189]|uniref:hypothetical protein n=1 Tax=Streptomyces sp. NPDC007189 TaxID=3154315 RepID=UPI003456E7BF